VTISKVALFANTDWYLFNFRMPLARALRSRGADVLLISPPGPYAARFGDLGFRWTAMPFDRRSLNPAAQAAAVARLARLYAVEAPDVVHHFTIKCAVYGSLAGRATRVPVIVNALAGLGSIHRCRDNAHAVARTLALGSLRLALKGTRVIVQNPEDHDFLLRERIARRDACTLIRGSGVDPERFHPRARQGDGLTVLLASRLIRTKGIDVFVRAATRLRSQRTDVRFVVAGVADKGNPDTLTNTEIDALRRNPDVELIGHVDGMESLLPHVDVVALPTTYGEGVPRILIEAAACGLPLVATDVPGCREIVRHQVNGLLVPPDDADALAAAVRTLADDPGLRARMGRESRRLAVAEFSEEAVVSATIAAYARDAEPAVPRARRWAIPW
jgi:glycosyltransferase involved in cell wall biosynthesis